MSTIAEAPLLNRHRITVSDYYRMAETGVLAPDARVELIDGEIIDMPPIGSRHAAAVARLIRAATHAVGDLAIVNAQNPLRLGDRSEPEPDLLLQRPRADFYAGAHPTAADVLLLIEVADDSVRYDREIKLPLYARHGVAEVWIVDLPASTLRIHRDPAGERYQDVSTVGAPGAMPVVALPGVAIDLGGLLG